MPSSLVILVIVVIVVMFLHLVVQVEKGDPRTTHPSLLFLKSDNKIEKVTTITTITRITKSLGKSVHARQNKD